LGIVFVTSSSGEIRVKKCVPGGPADVSQSIRQGDVLLKIDGFNCTGLPLKDIQPRVSPRITLQPPCSFE
jgi:C-terminal processing protease CtpA/Prc